MGPDIHVLEQIKDQYDGIIITNCFGTCVNIELYQEFCHTNNKILIFDNASSPYTFYNNTNILNYGDSCFISLHHTKQIGFGEGGAIIIDSNYKEEIEKIICFGYTQTNRIDYCTYASNFKMSEISAIYILQWLCQFNRILVKQRNILKYFLYKLRGYEQVHFFRNFADTSPSPLLMSCLPIIFDKPVDTSIFSKYEIQAKKYYYPLDSVSVNSMNLYDRIICLPLHTDIDYDIIDTYFMIIEQILDESSNENNFQVGRL